MPCAVILTALPVEYLAVRSHLNNLEDKPHPKGNVYEQGTFTERQTWIVGIAQIGAGNTQVSFEVERAIEYFKPDIILFVGVAGGIKGVELGDVVSPSQVYYYESGVAAETFLPRPKVNRSDYRLEQLANSEANKSDWLKRLSNPASMPIPKVIANKPIASGEAVVKSSASEILQFLRLNYEDSVAVEMEGFGFLEAARANKQVPAMVIRGISDLIDNKAEVDKEGYQKIAAHHASAFAFEILAKFELEASRSITQGQDIILSSLDPNKLLAEIGLRVESAVSNDSNSLTVDRHRRIDHARTLIDQGDFSQAVQYLEDLKDQIWYQADNILKYRLIANLGAAKLGLNEINDSAASFVEALQYNPEDDKAIANAAMGYVFQGDYNNAVKFIEKALQKNPANALAYSLRIRLAPITESIESILEKIPPAYHESPDVLVALGEAALDRGLHTKAIECWQITLDSNDDSNGMDSIKTFLGFALMEPIAKNYPLINAGQLLDSQKQGLERAVSLFTEVLGGLYVNPNDLSHLKFTALANRAAALRLLGRNNEAIRDVDMACLKEPEDPYLIKQRAILSREKGNEAEAYEYLSQILSSPKTPEAFLLATSSLITLKRDKEAEDILNHFLQKDIPEDFKWDAKRLKFKLFLDRNDRKNAEDTLNEINRDDPENIFTLIENIRWQKHIDSEEKIPELVERAKAALVSKASNIDQIILADFLYSLNYYRDAAEVYEQFVDKSLNTPLSLRLLQACYFSGNYKDALNLCKQLLGKYGPLPKVSVMAAYIYDQIGDMESARKVCEDYLNTFENNIEMKLRLAVVHYATGEYEKLDLFLDSKPCIDGLNEEVYKKLAQLYKVRERIDSFLKVIYEMRHHFYDNGQVHAFYQISYLEANKIQLRIQDFDVVQDGCGVLLKNAFGNEQWYILEDRPDADFAQHELNSSQPLYKALIGKKLEEEIFQTEDNFGNNALRILAVTDKFFAAGKQSFSVLENQPKFENFRMVSIPMDGENPSNDWVQEFIKGLQNHNIKFEKIKADYISGKFPFGAVAILMNRNPIEVWQFLALGASPFIHSWSNFQDEKFEDALISLQKGGLVVIDPISLITLHYLGVADDVVRLLGKFGIAQSTIDLFQALIEIKQGYQREGFTTFGIEEGQGVLQEVSPEQITQQSKLFEQIINWARSNCQILPCHRALDINKDERTKLNQYIGAAFIDTVLIAGESGRILYSDDQWLRWYAHNDSNVQGVWTQVILKYCLLQQNINEVLYRKATLDLTLWGYSYTIIDAGTLMEASKLTEWQIQPIYTSALKALAYAPLDYSVLVSSDFLRQLYLEAIITPNIIDPRDALTFELLKILTVKHSATLFVQELKKSIHQRFQVIPLQEEVVVQSISIWFSSMPFIT